MDLLYRGTKDVMTNTAFYNKCDNKGRTITLIQNDKGNIFGGYASISWSSFNEDHSVPDSFLFTITNIYNTKPTKFFSKNERNKIIFRKRP